MEYQKRPGTSGIDGQLYETKLLALILFRLQEDRIVENFHLATNIHDLGDFDDICLVVKIEGHDRPIAVFVQLKHKENDKAVIKFENKDKVKYVTSFIKITKRIASRQPWDDFFNGNLNESDCVFILYTNAKFSISNSEPSLLNSTATVLNSLLATSDTVGCRAQDSYQVIKDLDDYFLKNDLMMLSEHFVEFLIDKGNDRSMHIMNDEYVQQYHVILMRNVVHVGNIHTDEHELDLKWRTMTFRQDFFTTNDKYVSIFRDFLIKDLLKKQRERLPQNSNTSELSLEKIISLFLSAPSATTLMPLIITHIDCNEFGKLEFLIKRPSCDVELLQQTYTRMSQNDIDAAILAAKASAMEYLLSLELKVSTTFGNVDLAIRGSEKKVKRRLKYLTTAVCGLCKEYQQQNPYKIVTIGDHLPDGLLSYNGGLASAVGNMLTYDKTTNMLKFSNNFTTEQKIAAILFLNLENIIDDLIEYRFVVKTKRFPKLHFDCTDTAREFLSKLIIYEKQSNHWQVEEMLKEKIQQRLNAESRGSVMKRSDTSVSVFLHYHEEVLKWWMSPTTGTYLNKTTNLYERAIYNMESEPQISALQTMFYISKAKYFKINFVKNSLKWMDPILNNRIFIATDTVALTTVKVIQCLISYIFINKFAVLDFELVLNLPIADFNTLKTEIKITEKVLIIAWHKTPYNGDSDDRLSAIAQATKKKQLVVIINNELKEVIKEYFFSKHDIFYSETENLLNIKSQKEIMKYATVVFQCQEVTLDKILAEESVAFVKGGMLDKIICNETISIGEPLSNVQYEEIKDLYIDRSILHSNNRNDNDDISDDDDNIFTMNNNSEVSDKSSVFSSNNASSDDEHTSNDEPYTVNYYSVDYSASNKPILVKTFLDIQNDVVLLTAPPGMGKSTLLTHLSLNTKEYDSKLWIVRVDFRDYSNQFCEWYEDERVVDGSEALNFICQVISKKKSKSFDIEITNGEAHLVNVHTDDTLGYFELNMFLHFYNQRKLIFVFDGFDEICPYYKEIVLVFLAVVKNDLRKNKLWVTSRPYSEILPNLETVLGRCFKINYLTFIEQETYLRRFWYKKILKKNPNEKQLKNLRTFLDNTRESIYKARNWVVRIYNIFIDTIRPLVCQSTSEYETDNLNTILKSGRIMNPKRKVSRLSGIPLLLYFLADYFVNIVFTTTNRNKFLLEFNLHKVYEMFIENKLKTVLFQDKIKMDLSNTIARRLLDKELDDCISIHKKLAAYSFYEGLLFQKLEFEELSDMKPLGEQEWHAELNKIKTGTEKTGLISHVNADNVPVFIHRSFAEYFTAEYVCDIIKSDKFTTSQKHLWFCAITEDGNTAVKDWMETKKAIDPTLRNAFVEMEKTTPIYKTKYHVYLNSVNMSKCQYLRILASSVNDYENGCFSDYGEHFLTKYFNKFDEDIKSELTAYFTNYFISKMKPFLARYFKGLTFFKFRHPKANFVRDFMSAEHMDQMDGVFLKLKISGHRRSVPLFMLLDEYNCDTFQLPSTELMSNNLRKLSTDNIDQTNFVFIQFSSSPSPGCHYSFSRQLVDFFGTTRTIGNRLHYSETDVEEIAKAFLKNEISLLARALESYVRETNGISIDMTFNPYIKQYHVLLRQHVFDITDIQTDQENSNTKWRIATFRDDFFHTNDRFTASLRDSLIERMVSKEIRDIPARFLLRKMIPFFLSKPSVATLTPLLGSFIISCKENGLNFLIDQSSSDVHQLQKINVPQSTIDNANFAVRTAAIAYLRSLQLKVHIDFGNIDLTSSGFQVEMNIEYFKDAIIKLCERRTPYNVVTIDDTLDEPLLAASECLASCIGNLLIYDRETEMLKFQYLDQFTAAQVNAKSLYLQLTREIDNLHEYRFAIKTTQLPQCHFSFTNTVREFLKRVIVFAEKSNHYEIEESFSKEYESRLNTSKPFHGLVQKELAFLHCHSEVLKWWRTSKNDKCDTEPYDLYQQAMSNIKSEPVISDLHNSFYFDNLKYYGYLFNDNMSKSKQNSIIPPKLFIITETIILTTIKLLHRLKNLRLNHNYTVLDLDLMFSKYSFRTPIYEELRKTQKVLIIACTLRIDQPKILQTIAQLYEHKHVIIIADSKFRAMIQPYFVWSNVRFSNEIETLLTIQSYKDIMKDTIVIFQGQIVSLNVIVDDESSKYVEGKVLGMVINNDILYIGKPLGNIQRNEVKDTLIDMRVSPVPREDDEFETFSELRIVRSFNDILDDTVLLIAPTGLGISTLLTLLALNTKTYNEKSQWILKVNFADHVEEFKKWQDEDRAMDILEIFKFLCQVALNYKITSFDVALTNEKARLVSCQGDDLAIFELNLFLHFYNNRRVIFLFYGVYEIGPHYRDRVIQFVTVVSTCLRRSKMWVATESHSAVLSDLQRVLGEGFTIESCKEEI